MKTAEYKKIMKWHRCRRCKKLRWVYRETGYWYDLVCEDCELKILENDERPEDWEDN